MQGHFQIILNRQHCPLLQKDLSIPMRIMYASGVWSYVVGAISTPFFIIVPMVGLLAMLAQLLMPCAKSWRCTFKLLRDEQASVAS